MSISENMKGRLRQVARIITRTNWTVEDDRAAQAEFDRKVVDLVKSMSPKSRDQLKADLGQCSFVDAIRADNEQALIDKEASEAMARYKAASNELEKRHAALAYDAVSRARIDRACNPGRRVQPFGLNR